MSHADSVLGTTIFSANALAVENEKLKAALKALYHLGPRPWMNLPPEKRPTEAQWNVALRAAEDAMGWTQAAPALPYPKPDGDYVLVPTEPTIEMLNAYDEARTATTMITNGLETYNPHQSYWAMLAARPNQ